MTRKLVVVVLFGGRSNEHSISCATAGGILTALDRSKYEVIPVGITRDGAFVLEHDDPERFTLRPGDLPAVVDNGSRIRWPESAVTRELRVTFLSGHTRSLGEVDVVFPILHGRFGEDGSVQGMLELLGLPYVGGGVLSSALGMDKHFTKTVLEGAGIAVTPWVSVTSGQWQEQGELWRGRAQALGLPVFVKPARGGSSLGVTRVSQWEDLDAALATAFAEDGKVLIERAVAGREIECGVLSGRSGGPARVSLAGEIVMPEGQFYDFEAKYLSDSAASLICPVELGEGELREMQRIAARAFEAIGGSGPARVDFFFTGTDFIVNEINTMPGFTPISMFPKCWLASGLSYPELIDELILLGIETSR